MSPIADLAERFEVLLYIAFVAGAALYGRAFLRAHRRLAGTVFGLEREAIQAQRSVAVSMAAVLVFVAAAVYVFVHVVAPALVPTAGGARPTPAFAGTLAGSPGPVLQPILATLSAERLTAVALGTPLPTLQPTEAPVPGGVGCSNPQATLSEPGFAAAVAGPVEVKGTADIPDFAFYKLEINGPATEGNWQTLSAGSAPVSDGVLGTWDASLYTAGSYNFRLVVYDAGGNSPPPCVIPITIVTIP